MSQDTRRILHSAYSFVRSIESNKAAAALTLDHLIGEQITLLKKGETREVLDAKGESLGKRTSRFDVLETLEKDMTSLVKAIKDAGDDQAKLAKLCLSDQDLESDEGTA